jgi:hypothetical protein
MSDRAKKITELTVTASVANSDLFIIERVAANTTNTVTANSLTTYVAGKLAGISNGTSNVFVTGSAGNVIIKSSTNTWTFGTTGVLTLPGLLSAPLATQANNATGTAGQISWDADYIYVCVATNTWKRATLNSY